MGETQEVSSKLRTELATGLAELRNTFSPSALQTELAELRTALSQVPPQGESLSKANTESSVNADISTALQALQTEISNLANSVAEVQIALQNAFANQAGIDKSEPPAFLPFPEMAPPRLDRNPERLIRWGQGVSEAQREAVEAVLNDHAERAQQEIEALSADPMNPDPEVVARVMKESDEEITAELRKTLPPKDFEALFPPELEPEMPASQDNP
ncbi:hypothetical protein [Candidatus Thiosymbion oneisti]|uniref:hypothetical protein n=1 Tax=Candidatus Thiosymbion oneisti TaxID=589554 RepID=UPI00114CFFF4|nr:hypothetical protein [Candidatus Thiosymbion oneisti]